MKRFLAILAVLAVTAPASAADLTTRAMVVMPVKAAPMVAQVNPCSATSCIGWHVGFDILAAGTGVNVLNLGTLNANGTLIGLDGGYQYYDGSYWVGGKVLVAYNVAAPGNVADASFSDKLFAFEGVELGGNLFSALGIAPPQTNGMLSMLTSGVPTADVGACQHGSATGYCAGATLHYFLTNAPIEIAVSYINAQYGTTSMAPNQTINSENMGLFSVRYHF